MFRKLSGLTVNGVPQQFIDARFQYFHNYWQVTQPKDDDIFFDKLRLESHRSLLTKVEHQIRHNFQYSRARVDYLLTNHELFSINNIIARAPQIQSLIHSLSANYAIGNSEATRLANQNRILSEFKEIRKRVLDKNYSVKLAKYLVKVLSRNSQITSQVKEDIKFLVNSFVIELYRCGYGLTYISFIPDIITFSHIQYKFPFAKTIEDFSFDKDQYEAYVKEEEKVKTLDRCLSGLVNLVNRPLKNGFHVFKVNDLFLLDPHSIKIGDVEFYNPQKVRKINIAKIDEKIRKHLIQIEDFYILKGSEPIDISKVSYCNAIVSTRFVGPKAMASEEHLLQSFHKVNRSLEILNDVINRNGRSGSGYGRLSFHRHLKLHDNYRLADHSFDISDEKSMRLDIKNDMISESKLKDMESELLDLNKIDTDTILGVKLMNIISINSRFENNQQSFNFKDLWIAWESIMDIATFKIFIKEVYRFHYRKDYLVMTKGFLNINLARLYDYINPNYWSLGKKEIKSTGLTLVPNKIITTQSFKTRYSSIGQLVPIEMVHDVIMRIDNFINNQPLFFSKLNEWIENTVDEIYIERNMEVHKNLSNDLSKLKLKQNFLLMSRWLAYMMVEFTDKRRPEKLEPILFRIERAAQQVKTQ